MKHVLANLSVAVLFNTILAGCAVGGAGADDTTVPLREPIGEAPQALSAPGGDQCAPINDGLATLDGALQSAEAYAQADFDDNGTTGAYATAAQQNLGYLKEARQWLGGLHAWLDPGGDNNPNVTIYTEGYGVEGYLLQVIHSTMFATHWAEISAIYHHSQNARTSYEIAFQAMEMANDVRARGTRCYVDAYFTP